MRFQWNSSVYDADSPAFDPSRKRRGFRKLDSETVRSIFLSSEPIQTLAERFDVQVSHIENIRAGKSWRKITTA